MVANHGDANDAQTYAIIGSGIEVVRTIGTGFLEHVIKEALAIEFSIRGIPYMSEAPFPVVYKGHRLSGHYRADFVCFDSIVVEVKATNRNPELEQAQMLNYLKASGLKRGLLLNFAGPRMTSRRFVADEKWVLPTESG